MNQTDSTLAQVLRRRALEAGNLTAYIFLADGATDASSMTWEQLHRRASSHAAVLGSRGAAGEPVLLTLPSGLEFVEWLFACWYAGAIAVPLSLPRHERVASRLNRVIADAGARFAIGTDDTRRRLSTTATDKDAMTNLAWLSADDGEGGEDVDLGADPHDTALLQYTSGSTGSPRGVIVSHANLMRNSALIAEACGHAPGMTIGGWLPLFHDMGLVGLVMQAVFSGARCVFMPPERFLMRPWQWLQMISDYKICSSPAPNFAYDLCVDRVTQEHKRSLDLSGWRNALNGSEPVRAATLDRFTAAFESRGFGKRTFFPCYGLAEATLFVTGRGADGAKQAAETNHGHMGCGKPFGDTRLVIVNPQTRRRLPNGEIGEIWVAGESCAKGYWQDAQTTAATFNARLDSVSGEDAGRCWLRTGDLGMLADDGELFITGRLRELIIIAGRNLFPVDLELTAEAAHPAIAPSGVAAFSIEDGGAERLIIAAEVRREYGRGKKADEPLSLDLAEVARRVRAAITAEHEVAPHKVIVLRPGALPRTSSGKLRRGATRLAYLSESLDQLEGRHVRVH